MLTTLPYPIVNAMTPRDELFSQELMRNSQSLSNAFISERLQDQESLKIFQERLERRRAVEVEPRLEITNEERAIAVNDAVEVTMHLEGWSRDDLQTLVGRDIAHGVPYRMHYHRMKEEDTPPGNTFAEDNY